MKASGKRLVFAAAMLVGISTVASQEAVKLDNLSHPQELNTVFIQPNSEATEPEVAAVAFYSVSEPVDEAEQSVERSVDTIVEVVHELISKDKFTTDGNATETEIPDETQTEIPDETHEEIVPISSMPDETHQQIVPISRPDKLEGIIGEILTPNPEDEGTHDVEPVSGFVIPQYSGRWYEQGSSLETQAFTEGCECTQATYSIVDQTHRNSRSLRGKKDRRARPEKYIEVKNECYRSDKHREYTGITGSAVPVSPVVSTDPLTLEHAKLQVQFFGRPSIPDAHAEGNYWVVAVSTNIVDGETVYDNAIVSGSPGSNMVWFLTRDREVSDETFEQLKNTAIAAGISSDMVNGQRFSRTVQRAECDQLLSRRSEKRNQ